MKREEEFRRRRSLCARGTHLKELGLGEGEDRDSDELGKSDTRYDLGEEWKL
jgi:hypothetical protein